MARRSVTDRLLDIREAATDLMLRAPKDEWQP